MSELKFKNIKNELYKNTNYDSICNFIQTHCGKGKSVLDLNTRDGSHLMQLEKLGYKVFGTTKSVDKQCDISALKNKLIRGSAYSTKTKQKFDIITCLFNGVGKFPHYYYLDRVLANIEKHLSKGGFVVLDLFKASNFEPTYKNINENMGIKLLKYNKRLRIAKIEKQYTFKEQSCTKVESVKSFSLIQLRKIANKNNLSIVEAFENWSENIAGKESASIQLVLQRTEIMPTTVRKRHKRQRVTKKGKIKEVSQKTFIAILILVVAGGSLCGSSLGGLYVDMFLYTSPYDASYEMLLRDDVSKINYTGKTPEQLETYQSFLVAEKLLTQNDNKWSMLKTGSVVNPMIPQEIGGGATFDGTNLVQWSQSYSGSFDSAFMFKTVIGNKNVETIEGVVKNEGGKFVEWTGNSKTETEEQFREIWGISPFGLFPYIISSKTVISSSNWTVDGDKYTTTMSLDKEKSVILYVKQMTEQSKASGMKLSPKFSDISLTFTLDKNYRLLSYSIVEHYNAIVGCTGTVSCEFSY